MGGYTLVFFLFENNHSHSKVQCLNKTKAWKGLLLFLLPLPFASQERVKAAKAPGRLYCAVIAFRETGRSIRFTDSRLAKPDRMLIVLKAKLHHTSGPGDAEGLPEDEKSLRDWRSHDDAQN